MTSIIDRIEHYSLSGRELQERREISRLKAKLNIVPAISMPVDWTPRLRAAVKSNAKVESVPEMVSRLRNEWRRK